MHCPFAVQRDDGAHCPSQKLYHVPRPKLPGRNSRAGFFGLDSILFSKVKKYSKKKLGSVGCSDFHNFKFSPATKSAEPLLWCSVLLSKLRAPHRGTSLGPLGCGVNYRIFAFGLTFLIDHNFRPSMANEV